MIYDPKEYAEALLTPGESMWLTASKFIGLTEIPGERHNPQILTFFKDIGHNWVQTDETAWCSAFINYIALKCDCKMSGELTARSWLKDIGEVVKTPQLGDGVVFWRGTVDDGGGPDGWKGHITLWGGENKKHIWGLGGNQNGQVNLSTYPQYRKLAYIRLPYLKAV